MAIGRSAGVPESSAWETMWAHRWPFPQKFFGVRPMEVRVLQYLAVDEQIGGVKRAPWVRRLSVLLAGTLALSCLAGLSGCSALKLCASAPKPPSRTAGIDVSIYQHTIRWRPVARDGVAFAWTKATEGSRHYLDYTDPQLAANIAGATANGVLIGVYHFAHPEKDPGAGGARAEARLFVSTAGAYMTAGYLRPVLDIEVEGSPATSAWVNDFLDDVYQATGVMPIIYTYTNYAASYLRRSVADRDLWMADVTGADPQTGSPLIFPFHHWNFWQYGQAASGKISGIAPRTGPVDKDVANGNPAYVESFLIPAGSHRPGAGENEAITDVWTGADDNGHWRNSANWINGSAWRPGDAAMFTDASRNTGNIKFDEVARGREVINVDRIEVQDARGPAVTINGPGTLRFQTCRDPLCNNGVHPLIINAPAEFFGTMGNAVNAATNSIYVGPGNVILNGPVTFNDSQTQVVRCGFHDLIAVWDSHLGKVPGNVIFGGPVADATGTPRGNLNGFLFSNAGGYDEIRSNNTGWKGGICITGGATLLVAAGGATGSGPVRLDGTPSRRNGLQPAGIHGGIAGCGAVHGPVTLSGNGGSITGGGGLNPQNKIFTLSVGKLTLAAGLDMNGKTATFNFFFAHRGHSSITIGRACIFSARGTVVIHGTPSPGQWRLMNYTTLINAADLASWKVRGPQGFRYSLGDNTSNGSIDVLILRAPKPARPKKSRRQ